MISRRGFIGVMGAVSAALATAGHKAFAAVTPARWRWITPEEQRLKFSKITRELKARVPQDGVLQEPDPDFSPGYRHVSETGVDEWTKRGLKSHSLGRA